MGIENLPSVTVEVWHNNSGGRWWLDAPDYAALAKAGFVLKPKGYGENASDLEITIYGTSDEDAAIEVAQTLWRGIVVTARRSRRLPDPYVRGCDCCGTPFHFSAW